LTEKAKKDARKKKRKLTLEEEESALMATAAGQANWKANQQKAQDLYFEAMELDRSNALAHRGLGMLFEKIQKREQAIREYRKYLELAPNAIDRLRIVSRLEALEKSH
jgi:Flp pilus assembly protein TadD